MSASAFDFEKLLTPAEVCRWIGVGQRTLFSIRNRNFAGRPPLKPVIATHGLVRYDPNGVRCWLESGSEPTTRRRRGRPRKYKPEAGK